MSGFVPRRVAMTRTASATTDMKAATWNNQLISTIGRRSTLRNQIQKRSFGSFLQINYYIFLSDCSLYYNLLARTFLCINYMFKIMLI